jgi:ATP-dependent DNA helicase PIF1
MDTTKCYAVAVGRLPGIYMSWDEANEQINGWPKAIYRKFQTIDEAKIWINSKTMQHTLLYSLTEEQQCVVATMLEGHNIFLTGGGGVGKSYLLSVICGEFPALYQKYKNLFDKNSFDKNSSDKTGINKFICNKPPTIQICALTGCAALLLGNRAKTLHSWAGIGLGKETVDELYIKIRKNMRAWRNWIGTDILIIDEVSMLTNSLLDKLNELSKRIRGSKKAFGGIQVILVGDFYQLPPVIKGDNAVSGFAFTANAWTEMNLHTIELTIIQRQKDEVFQQVLKEARVGMLSKASCKIIEACKGKPWQDRAIRPTLIFPRRAEVEMINETNLRALKGQYYTFNATLVYDAKRPRGFVESNEVFQRALSTFDANAPYLLELELSLHTQVMLIHNLDADAGLVNGSRGVIVGFCAATNAPIVEFINGMRKTIGVHSWPIEEYTFVSRSQIPLRLAYATTIHRSQGSSLDAALVDIGLGNFEYGQAYVALSRVRTLDALYVHDFNVAAFKAHPAVKEFYKNMVSYVSDVDIFAVHDIKENDVINKIDVIKEISVIKEEEEKEKEKEKEKEEVKEKVEEVKEKEEEEEKEAVEEEINWLFTSIPIAWKNHLEHYQSKLLSLSTILSQNEFLPSRDNIWKSLIPIENIRVVILGQDPYHTPGYANGLAFSVSPDVKPLPPSLKNIYKELHTDINALPSNGSLEKWLEQGVMLLNTILTVKAGIAQSHAKIGWEVITDHIIHTIASKCQGVVFILWGKAAKSKYKIIEPYIASHRMIESVHPSPLSASHGFFGSKPFSTANILLSEMGKAPINWTL